MVCTLLAQVSLAQQTPKAALETSETIFSVMAVLNSCGYDQELNASNPLRMRLRAEIGKAAAASPEAVEAQRQVCGFYRDHQQPEPTRDLAQYISLALSMAAPPEFALTVKE